MGKEIRNIVLLGHQGCGKTMTTEALLYVAKNTTRFGHIEEGNTISDYDIEERNRKISVQTSLIPLLYNQYKINILDTPGYLEFDGGRTEGMQAADLALIEVSARSGIKTGTERTFSAAAMNNIPLAFVVNKIDKEHSSFEKVYNDLRDCFGNNVVTLSIPVIRDYFVEGVIDVLNQTYSVYDFRTNTTTEQEIPEDYATYAAEAYDLLMEVIAESNEDYLMEYIDNGALDQEQMINGLKEGIAIGEIYPVMCISAQTCKGVQLLLDFVCNNTPSPLERTFICTHKDGGEEVERNISTHGNTLALVFKTIADPFVGKLSFVKVLQGTLETGTNIYNTTTGESEKINGLYYMRGKDQKTTDAIEAGDIGLIAKLQSTKTNDTLCEKHSNIKVKTLSFEKPTLERVVVVTKKTDEDKVLSALTKIQEEDPSIHVYRDEEFLELRIQAMGETHLDVIKSKLLNKFDIHIEYELPKVPYRETIKGNSDVQGRYKKQSGGHGQFGDVKIIFEPRTDGEDDLLFVNKVVGGAVPRQYIPAVEKGLLEAMHTGVLCGFPLIRLQATLYDGTYHTVDSSEYAFKVAASLAYKKGIQEANPCILEPILRAEIILPAETVGDVMSEITRKRGRILGMEEVKEMQYIIAEVPESEMLSFTSELKSLTGGKGKFSTTFERYEELTYELAKKLIEQHKKELVHH